MCWCNTSINGIYTYAISAYQYLTSKVASFEFQSGGVYLIQNLCDKVCQ